MSRGLDAMKRELQTLRNEREASEGRVANLHTSLIAEQKVKARLEQEEKETLAEIARLEGATS